MAYVAPLSASEQSLETAAAEHTREERAFGFWIYLMSDAIIFSLLFATYAVMVGRSAAAFDCQGPKRASALQPGAAISASPGRDFGAVFDAGNGCHAVASPGRSPPRLFF